MRNTVDAETLETLRKRGGTWAVYENQDFGSADMGRRVHLRYGEGCTFPEPPRHAPDGAHGMGWRYVLLGTVNTETGEITKGDE